MRLAAALAGVAVSVLAVTGCSSSPAPPEPTTSPASASPGSSADAAAYVTEFALATQAVFEAANATALEGFDQESKMLAVEVAITSQEALQAAQTWLSATTPGYTPPSIATPKFADADQAKQAQVKALTAWQEVCANAVPTGDAVMDEVIASSGSAAAAYLEVLNQP